MLSIGEIIRCVWLPYYVLGEDVTEHELSYTLTAKDIQDHLERLRVALPYCMEKLAVQEPTGPMDPDYLRDILWQVAKVAYPDTELSDMEWEDAWQMSLAGHRFFAAWGEWHDLIMAAREDEAEEEAVFNPETIQAFLRKEFDDNVPPAETEL